MNTSRIVRDLLALGIACVGLWGVYQTLSMFSSRNVQTYNGSAVSEARELSDAAFDSEKWQTAIEANRKLTEADQFNARAWYRLGVSCWQHFQILDRQFTAEEGNANPDQIQLSTLKEESQKLQAESIKALEQSAQFGVYQNESRRALAEIYAYRREPEKVFEMLEAAVRDGYCTRYGLQLQGQFGFLIVEDKPRYDKLLRNEEANIQAAKSFRTEPIYAGF